MGGLIFIDLHTRRVLVGGITAGPANRSWCAQIARNLTNARESRDTPIRLLVHDRDKRFDSTFDEVFRAEGVEILRTPWRATKANAYAERFIRTVRTECLDRILILGEGHLQRVLETYVDHYNNQRRHRGRDLHPPNRPPPVVPLAPGDGVARRDRLGGLIHKYHRRAA